MRYQIKARLAMLGKTQVDLLKAIRLAGYTVNSIQEISAYTTGTRRTPKAETVLAACDEIVKEWEKKGVNQNV